MSRDEAISITAAEWAEACYHASENWTVDPHQHIDALIQAGDAAIAALRAPEGAAVAAAQCAVCMATYAQGGQRAGSHFSLSISGRLVCKRCVSAGRDARIADDAAALASPVGGTVEDK